MLFVRNTSRFPHHSGINVVKIAVNISHIFTLKNAPNPMSAGAPHQTPLGELTALFFTALSGAPSWI